MRLKPRLALNCSIPIEFHVGMVEFCDFSNVKSNCICKKNDVVQMQLCKGQIKVCFLKKSPKDQQAYGFYQSSRVQSICSAD